MEPTGRLVSLETRCDLETTRDKEEAKIRQEVQPFTPVSGSLNSGSHQDGSRCGSQAEWQSFFA